MAMSPDLERAKLFDFTGPVTVNPYHFVTPYPEEESKLDRLMQPFQSEVSPENRKKKQTKENKTKRKTLPSCRRPGQFQHGLLCDTSGPFDDNMLVLEKNWVNGKCLFRHNGPNTGKRSICVTK